MTITMTFSFASFVVLLILSTSSFCGKLQLPVSQPPQPRIQRNAGQPSLAGLKSPKARLVTDQGLQQSNKYVHRLPAMGYKPANSKQPGSASQPKIPHSYSKYAKEQSRQPSNKKILTGITKGSAISQSQVQELYRRNVPDQPQHRQLLQYQTRIKSRAAHHPNTLKSSPRLRPQRPSAMSNFEVDTLYRRENHRKTQDPKDPMSLKQRSSSSKDKQALAFRHMPFDGISRRGGQGQQQSQELRRARPKSVTNKGRPSIDIRKTRTTSSKYDGKIGAEMRAGVSAAKKEPALEIPVPHNNDSNMNSKKVQTSSETSMGAFKAMKMADAESVPHAPANVASFAGIVGHEAMSSQPVQSLYRRENDGLRHHASLEGNQTQPPSAESLTLQTPGIGIVPTTEAALGKGNSSTMAVQAVTEFTSKQTSSKAIQEPQAQIKPPLTSSLAVHAAKALYKRQKSGKQFSNRNLQLSSHHAGQAPISFLKLASSKVLPRLRNSRPRSSNKLASQVLSPVYHPHVGRPRPQSSGSHTRPQILSQYRFKPPAQLDNGSTSRSAFANGAADELYKRDDEPESKPDRMQLKARGVATSAQAQSRLQSIFSGKVGRQSSMAVALPPGRSRTQQTTTSAGTTSSGLGGASAHGLSLANTNPTRGLGTTITAPSQLQGGVKHSSADGPAVALYRRKEVKSQLHYDILEKSSQQQIAPRTLVSSSQLQSKKYTTSNTALVSSSSSVHRNPASQSKRLQNQHKKQAAITLVTTAARKSHSSQRRSPSSSPSYSQTHSQSPPPLQPYRHSQSPANVRPKSIPPLSTPSPIGTPLSSNKPTDSTSQLESPAVLPIQFAAQSDGLTSGPRQNKSAFAFHPVTQLY